MELPTYTSIWRIEKRLYKLYDFRLPMPVPVGQIAVFAAITVPYIVLLTVFGLPFNHNLFWLYVLPPGLLTWLATRPVLESKRLPELILSQARYLGEPRTWCRMKPLAETDEILVFGRVWRRARIAGEILEPAAEQPAIAPAVAGQTRQPIAAPSAQRGRKPAELPAGRWARQVTGPAGPGSARARATEQRARAREQRARATEQAVGHPAPARDAAPTGYPQVVRDPERAPRVPAREPRAPAREPAGRWRPPRPPGNDGGPDASRRAAWRRWGTPKLSRVRFLRGPCLRKNRRRRWVTQSRWGTQRPSRSRGPTGTRRPAVLPVRPSARSRQACLNAQRRSGSRGRPDTHSRAMPPSRPVAPGRPDTRQPPVGHRIPDGQGRRAGRLPVGRT